MLASKILDWTIGLYVVFDLFGRSWLNKVGDPLRCVLPWFPLILLGWTLAVAVKHLRFREKNLPFYHRLQMEDYFRWFFILWAGHTPLATDHLVGFYIFTALAVGTVVLLLAAAGLELCRKRELTPLVLGCAVFLYLLFVWEKKSYVEHYGVHIIGHYLEKTSYKTRYYVQIERDGSDCEMKAIAHISVGGTSDEYYDGEDYYGNDVWRSYERREVWISRIQLPDGRSISVAEQSEPLEVRGTTFVTDDRGNEWHVELLDEPVQQRANTR